MVAFGEDDLRDGTAPTMTVPLQPESPHRPSRAPRVIYVALLLVPLILGACVVLIRTGVISGRTGSQTTPWDLAVIFLGIAGTLVMAFYAAKRVPGLLARSKRDAFDSQLSTWEFATLCVSAPVSAAIGVLAFLHWSGVVAFLHLPAEPMAPLVMGAIALLVACAPMAYFDYQRERNARAIEARFPDLLRDLNESHASGMTMAQAIRVAARGDYGKLNPEVRRMAHQISWGTSFPDTLRMFSDRVGTPLVVRAVSLINKATEAGGNVKDVLAAAARDAREIGGLQADRRAGMALYVIIVYVAFFVFLGVVAALQGMLVPSLLTSTRGVEGGSIGALSVGGRLEYDDFRFIYFGTGLVQALGSGMVAGVMSEGGIEAGLKHACILVACTVLALGILL
ncbi:MAG TPA: type II secretion system F family protein [Candidatus Thermoplasmatota archaeon]|nr:type II secretion system F family protein [Candidatus Thermoplasmatota archaeon]